MSPPIRDGSGNSIGAIRLGDGSEISEVRTGAGDVVFSAITIPDNPTHQYKLDKDSGTTFDDSIGFIDGQTNGADFVSDADLVGGNALDIVPANGDDPAFDSNFSVGISDTWSIGVTIVPDSNSSSQTVWQQSNGNDIFTIGTDNSSSDTLGVQVFDGGASSRVIQRGGDVSLSGKIRIGAVFDTNNDVGELYINGSEISYGGNFSKIADTTFTGNNLGHRNSDERLDGKIDNFIFYTDKLTAGQWQTDYDNQPWS